jgi:transposase
MTHFLGIDIAKKKFDVALRLDHTFKHKTFTNDHAGFEQLRLWLDALHITTLHACLEATNIYGQALAHYLVDNGLTVSILNPAQIKAFAQSQLSRHKNDTVDAKLIALFAQTFQPPAWQPLPPHQRELQALVRRLDDLIRMRTQETLRLQVAPPIIQEDIRQHLDSLKQQITSLKLRIRQCIQRHDNFAQARDLLASIPGIGESTIAQLLACVGDLARFHHPKQLVAFLGLHPTQRQSGSSLQAKPRLAKMGNPALRKAFFMPALAAMRHNPVIQQFARRLKQNGKHAKAIICAVMRKLIHLMFGVLRSRQPFNPQLNIQLDF